MNAKNLCIREISAVIKNLIFPKLAISSRRMYIALENSPIKTKVQIARKSEEKAESSEANRASEYVFRQLITSKSSVLGIRLKRIGASRAITNVPKRP